MNIPKKAMIACFVTAMASQASAVNFHLANFSINDGGYTVSNTGLMEDPWNYAPVPQLWETNGSSSVEAPTSTALTSPVINVPSSGAVTLSFVHQYQFEFDLVNRFDGGAVFVSVNAGPFQHVPGASFLSNGYDGVITGLNALNGLTGFNGVSGFPADFTPGNQSVATLTSVANLGAFNAGDTLQVRFLAAFDDFDVGSEPNWHLGAVQLDVASTVAIPEPATALLGALAAGTLALRRRAAYR